jgi:tetratricopeptide (TPR) repeat protein
MTLPSAPDPLDATIQAAAPAEISFAGGRYVVRRVLPEGGQKIVYLVRDTALDRDCALSLLKTNDLDSDQLSRLRDEARAMARLNHPAIVTVYDIGEEDGRPFIVCEFVPGGDLRHHLRAAGGPLPLDRAIALGENIASGLAQAHIGGVIHRDLKPGNVWLGVDGTAKIGDFGLAVALDRSVFTGDGLMVGTAAYMAPEQALGATPDARSDLYAFGVMLYEMVTGRPPFLGDDAVAVISQHLNTAPVDPSWHNPNLPRPLETLILSLLAKDPDERPASAIAVLDALRSVGLTPAPAARATEEQANPLDRLAAGVFVGREAEAGSLRAALDDAFSGRGRVILLGGEPGIGKTRIADELCTYARMRGAQVLWGRCYEGEGAPAYWPWVQVIRSYVHDRDPEDLTTQMGAGAADIAQVVSELRERLPGLPPPPSLEPEQARFRLFDSISTFLKNAANGQPLVIVLDDLHWADRPSLLLLQFLAQEMRASRLLVIGTYRDVELVRQHPLTQTLAELARQPVCLRLALQGLSAADVARFIEMTAGAAPPESLVAAVYRETEGNPFFTKEIVRLLVSEGRLDSPDEIKSWSVEIPQGVREVIGRRLDRLSEECGRLLSVASVIGREFGTDALELVSGVDGDRLLDVLEEALASRSIAESPRAVGRYTFTHALIRETLYDEISAARRARLHRQIGEALEHLSSTRSAAQIAELAHHFLEAARGGGDVDKAIAYARAAAERAMALFAYEEAVAHYQRALEAIGLRDEVDEALRCDLLILLGEAQTSAGGDTAREALAQAVSIARKLGSANLLARAVLAKGTEWDSAAAAVDPSLAGPLEEALAALGDGDSVLRVRVLASLANALYYSPDRSRPHALSREAVAMARRIGDQAALADALYTRHFVLPTLAEDLQDRLAAGTEIVQLAGELGDSEMAVRGPALRFIILLELGDVQQATEVAEAVAPLAEELRLPIYIYYLATYRAMRALLEGRFAEAEPLIMQALAAGQRVPGDLKLQTYGIQVFALRWGQGRLQEVEPAFKTLVGQYPMIPGYRAALAFLYTEIGRNEDARIEFERLAEGDSATVPRDNVFMVTMSLLAQTCAALRDKARAAVLYEMLAPFAERNVTASGGIVCNGWGTRYLGLLASTLGRWDDGSRHFEDALRMNGEMGARPFVAYTQFEYADMLLRRGDAGDAERAAHFLAEASQAAGQLGMAGLARKIEGLPARPPSASV